MPLSPRAVASPDPDLASTDSIKLAKALGRTVPKDASGKKLRQKEKVPLPHVGTEAPAPLKSKKRRKRGAESVLGIVDFAVPTESSSSQVPSTATDSKSPATVQKRRDRAAKKAIGNFCPKACTPEHLVGTKVANLFAEIVPGIEKSVPTHSVIGENTTATQREVKPEKVKRHLHLKGLKTQEVECVDPAACIPAVVNTSPTTSVELREQLREKIQRKKLKRKAPGAASSSEGSKKLRNMADAPAATSSSMEVSKKLGSGAAHVVELGPTAYRKAHDIFVTGSCAAPFETFNAVASDFGQPLIDALRLQGYVAPTPIQAHAWPIALRGQDMVAVAKTGSGKTCGFLLPALARLSQCAPMVVPKKGEPALPRVLVLAPTRELAQQIAGEGDKFVHITSSRIVALYGGVPKGPQIRELELGADIVIATTGRLLDFSTGRPEKGLGPTVSMKQVSYLVLDEADRMLDMGFEPDIRKIIAECPKSKLQGDSGRGCTLDLSGSVRQTLFFTATWPKTVQRTAASLTAPGAVQLRIGQGGSDGDKLTANTSVTQKVMVVDERQKLTHLKSILEKELGPGETAFVFAKTRKTCDYLEDKLWDEKEDLSIGTWCRAIHSHKEQWVRDESLATFRVLTAGKDNGRKGILVATDVAARGLDIPGVALVVVYDFGGGNLGEDSGVESYVHRIGRTGRAEKKGRAFTFFTEHDSGAAKFVELLDDAKQRVPDELRTLADKYGKRSGGKGGQGGKGGKWGKGGKGDKGGGKGGKGWGKDGKGKSGKGGKGGKGKSGKGGKGRSNW